MIITPEIMADFRAWPLGNKFFSDNTKFPDELIAEALAEADSETGGSGWGAYQMEAHNFKRKGMYYFAAAWLQNNFPAGVNGSSSGEARLNIAEKSVGDESVSYRVPSIMEVGDDWLTWSIFGQQFFRLRKRAGMGARAV